MSDFTLEPRRKILCKPKTGNRPEFWERVVVDESEILNLTVETGDETKLGLCATICLIGG